MDTQSAWKTYSPLRCRCQQGGKKRHFIDPNITPSQERAREFLIENYYSLVRKVAGKMWKLTPPQVDFDDLISYGTLGLIRAVEHYDYKENVTFETYAVASIRGVILDELRTLDWAPRSLRRKQREIDRATEAFEGARGRTPTAAEVSAWMKQDPAYVVTVMKNTEQAKQMSLDEPNGDGETSKYANIEDPDATQPAVVSERQDVMDAFVSILEKMSVQEQLVLVLHYFEGMSFAEVGRVAGIEEEQAQQIHTGAVVNIRDGLLSLVAS